MLLDLRASGKQDFASFVAGARQGEALDAVSRAVTERQSAYLWGKPGTGKSHLLAAAASHARELGIVAGDFGVAMDAAGLVIIDDVGRATKADQDRLFTLLKACAEGRGPTVLASGAKPPAKLALRQSVRTRLAQLPAYHLPPLSDAELRDTLVAHAKGFGRDLRPEVASLLVLTLPRNLGHLTRALHELDRHFIAANAKLDVAGAREWLRRQRTP